MAGFVFYMTFLFKKGMDEENGTVCKNMTMNIYYYFLI